MEDRIKKVVTITTAILLVLTFISCSNAGSEQTETSSTAQTENNVKQTKAEKISDRIVKYTNSLDDPVVLYLAKVKNTDSIPLEFGNVTIDLNDANGKILSSAQYETVHPNYIMPGEYGYIACDLASFDSSIVLDNVGTAEMHFGTKVARNYKKPNVEISEVSIKQSSYGGVDIVGRATAKEKIDSLDLVIILTNQNDEIQALALAGIEGLENGMSKGFEASPMDIDPNIDISTLKAEVIPYFMLYN